MRIAMYLYDGMTALDAVGPFDLLNRIPDVTFAIVGDRAGPKHANGGLTLTANHDIEDVTAPEVVIMPGGGARGVRAQIQNTRLLGWLAANHPRAKWTTSVCTGALILGAAGILEGRRATTHWRAREHLAPYGATYVDARVVEDGSVITGAGVTAGIDMALLLADRSWGRQVAEAVQLSAHYNPEPPFPPQRHATASTEVLAIISNDLGPR